MKDKKGAKNTRASLFLPLLTGVRSSVLTSDFVIRSIFAKGNHQLQTWDYLLSVTKYCNINVCMLRSSINIQLYKITKIVRALWLAERSVCMRVCKHGCGVKMFCFSLAINPSTNLKKFSNSKLHKFTLFTHSFVGWNLENPCKEGVLIFLRWSWHFKLEKSVFWKASFCKTRTDYSCKSSRTRLCDW